MKVSRRTSPTYGVDTLYRYEEHFQDPDKALSHFADVPFLNGGLFECLDRTDEDTGKKALRRRLLTEQRRNAPASPTVSFSLGEQTVDLSEAYGDTEAASNARRFADSSAASMPTTSPSRRTPLSTRRSRSIRNSSERSSRTSSPLTTRKPRPPPASRPAPSTPRAPSSNTWSTESLKAHLTGSLTKLDRKQEEAREHLDLLLGYTDEEPSFSEEETNALLEAIHTCKILDPACGSGAFPIGMLQKLVHVVHKLDPDNARWKQLQIDQASKIPDSSARDAAIKAIERDFEENGDDYGRKLYLIENCLYGVDIQPIAIQISKLRFFISLICDQKTSRDKAKNHGIRALPNLETKFVAANTLVRLLRWTKRS